MKKKYTWRLIIATLAIMAALVMIFVTIAIVTPPRTSKAQKYDLNCVTELKKNPLQECKHE
jgi:hypothetical protein